MKSFQDFQLSLLLMGWSVMRHDGVGIKQKWERKGLILTKRKYVNPAYIIYGSDSNTLNMIRGAIEFNNIYEVMAYLEKTQ